MDSYHIIIFLSVLVIGAHLLGIVSSYLKVSSVILLMSIGFMSRLLAPSMVHKFDVIIPDAVEILGTLGLVMIILEAALDLEVNKKNKAITLKAAFGAFSMLIITAFVIAVIFNSIYIMDFRSSMIYAIPLSIISSAVVLPSIHFLTGRQKEFLIYDVSFSDIFGIILFNFIATESAINLFSFISLTGSLVVSAFFSILFSFIMFFILAKSDKGSKLFFVFSILVLLYVIGKMAGLPSLLVILFFGLLVNNYKVIPSYVRETFFKDESIDTLEKQIKVMTVESSFLIRSFFFFIFGFSINHNLLADYHVILWGTVITIAIFLIRYSILKFILKGDVFNRSLVFPRGLISVLLFYKIPDLYKSEEFNIGIIFFVVIASSLVMTFALFFMKDKHPIDDHVEDISAGADIHG